MFQDCARTEERKCLDLVICHFHFVNFFDRDYFVGAEKRDCTKDYLAPIIHYFIKYLDLDLVVGPLHFLNFFVGD
jgi:hypothetical protein